MPENISVEEFLRVTWEDVQSPTTSNFVPTMGKCKNTVSMLDEVLDAERSGLIKMKKSVKALYSSGNMHVSNEAYLAENLERLGNNAHNRENEKEIGAAFLKFSIVTKELSALMKNIMQSISNIVLFPLDSFLKGDLRGVKGDMKKPFDKACKEYDSKFSKLEKEKKQLAKEAGMIKTEITGAEVAEDLEKERRAFQFQMCEYLIKVNEIKTKKGVDLLQHLVEYYQAQTNYFQDGLKTIEHFKTYIESLVAELAVIRQHQEEERKKLAEIRDSLKATMTTGKEILKERLSSSSVPGAYNLHQLQGNKAHGFEKHGNLLKKSEGRMFGKVWQRRRCLIKDGCLFISHSDLSKEPVKLNLLTCQVKLVPEDPTKKCFDLISSSKNRTYHFQADDHRDMEEWISVLNNAKEKVLMQAFGDAPVGTSPVNQNLRELTRQILAEVRRLPGNGYCCDCGAPDPDWLSVNLGVLICLECCGAHREMGVHVSRTQSIVIDHLTTSQLLLARVVSNKGFNEIMEATLDHAHKPSPDSSMDVRKNFIRAKYEKHRYAIVTCTHKDERRQDLKQAILSSDFYALLQVYAEGVDFMEPLPDCEGRETALHLAVQQEEISSLYMVDFILQNSNSQHLGRLTRDGSSVLHLCVEQNHVESLKLVLRVAPDLVGLDNSVGMTALDIAKEKGHDLCAQLLNHAIEGKTELFENVNIDWDLIPDEHLFDNVDYSDDDLDSCMTPDKKARSRPGSLVLPYDSSQSLTSQDQRVKTQMFATPQAPPPLPHKPRNLSKACSVDCQSLSGTLTRRKAPAPPPPAGTLTFGHARKPSLDLSPRPNAHAQFGHSRTPSDPPPFMAHKQKTGLPGAKLVLPPPPEFKTAFGKQLGDALGLKPVPSPRSAGARDPEDARTRPTSMMTSSSQQADARNGRRSRDSTDSMDSLDSLGSSDALDQYSAGDSSTLTKNNQSTPVPTPRQKKRLRGRRCRALYDCEAENADELSFIEGEVILVTKEEEEEWWEGEIEGEPNRKGLFPVTFVHMLNE